MDLFRNAKVVRLRSHHDKYLVAEEDEESVIQSRNGSSRNALWTVELVPNSQSVICLKSCYDKYLTASNERFLLGATGRKVVQTSLESSLGWEPIRGEGTRVKLKTQFGKFLKANGGVPPWRNSVTHDDPVVTSTHNTIWDVDVVDQNQNESTGGGMTMEELHMAASAYYNNASPKVKKLAQDFFDSMDTDKDGQVSIDEFTDFFKQLDDVMDRSFFAALDRNGNGSLQFGEVLTLNYIIITGQNGRNMAQAQQFKESARETASEPDAKNGQRVKRIFALEALWAVAQVVATIATAAVG